MFSTPHPTFAVSSRTFKCDVVVTPEQPQQQGHGHSSSQARGPPTRPFAFFVPWADLANHSFSSTAHVSASLSEAHQTAGEAGSDHGCFSLSLQPNAASKWEASQGIPQDPASGAPGSSNGHEGSTGGQGEASPSTTSTSAGPPLWISYGGSLDSLQLLLRYSFVIPGNANDSLDLAPGVLGGARVVPHIGLLSRCGSLVSLSGPRGVLPIASALKSCAVLQSSCADVCPRYALPAQRCRGRGRQPPGWQP